jgi:hypothetical protein
MANGLSVMEEKLYHIYEEWPRCFENMTNVSCRPGHEPDLPGIKILSPSLEKYIDDELALISKIYFLGGQVTIFSYNNALLKRGHCLLRKINL